MPIGYKTRKALIVEGQKYLAAKRVKAFYSIMDGLSFEDGVNALIKVSGFGKMSPNMVLMGYKSDWRYCPREELIAYFHVLYNSFSCRMAVAILRLPIGLDFSDMLHQEIKTPNGNSTPSNGEIKTISGYIADPDGTPNLQQTKTSGLFHVDSNLNLPGMVSSTSSITVPQPPPMPNRSAKMKKNLPFPPEHQIVYTTKGGSEVPKDVLDALTVFSRKQPKGTIDVWWLYDDGGFTMLLPYIISMRSSWSQCKLRVFALTNRQLDLDVEEKKYEAPITNNFN